MGGSNLRTGVTLGLILLAVVWVGRALTNATYSADGFCLLYPRGIPRYEFSSDIVFGLFGTRGLPAFKVPSSIPTSSIMDDPKETGLIISYDKWGSPDFRHYDHASCPSTDTGLGLLRFGPRQEGMVSSRSCPALSNKLTLLPMPTEPLAGSVFLLCDDDLRVPNCRMEDNMPNGWTASISLPRSHLSEWRTASASARAFFAETLTDCGDPSADRRS